MIGIAIKVMEDTSVGHLPRNFSRILSFVLLSGGNMKVRVTHKRVNRRKYGLEVPCKVIIKAPRHAFLEASVIYGYLSDADDSKNPEIVPYISAWRLYPAGA